MLQRSCHGWSMESLDSQVLIHWIGPHLAYKIKTIWICRAVIPSEKCTWLLPSGSSSEECVYSMAYHSDSEKKNRSNDEDHLSSSMCHLYHTYVKLNMVHSFSDHMHLFLKRGPHIISLKRVGRTRRNQHMKLSDWIIGIPLRETQGSERSQFAPSSLATFVADMQRAANSYSWFTS